MSILAGLTYFYRYLVHPYFPIPEPFTVAPWFLFGLFFALFSIGFYYYLISVRKIPLIQSGMVLNILASVFATAMFVVQSTTFDIGYDDITIATGSQKEVAKSILIQVNAVHLGIGMVWDIFVSSGLIFFGVGLLNIQKILVKVGAFSGIILGFWAMIVNFYTFPESLSDADYFDPEPFIGIWYTIVALPLMGTSNFGKWDLLDRPLHYS